MENKLKSASSVKTGLLFINARKELGLSIQDISSKHMINEKYIRGIESGIYDKFPSEGFARAYFLKYAHLLKINPEFPSIYSLKPRKDEIVNKSFKSINDNLLKIILGISALLAIIFILVMAINNSSSDKDLMDSIADSEIIITQSSIDLTKDLQQEISINIPEEIPSISKNKLEALSSSDDKISFYSEEPIQKDQISIPKNELVLYFNDECWIDILADGSSIKSGLFSKGDSLTLIILKPFQIRLGNAYAINGTYNNEPVDFITGADTLNVNTIFLSDE